jgi:hypothetical protein
VVLWFKPTANPGTFLAVKRVYPKLKFKFTYESAFPGRHMGQHRFLRVDPYAFYQVQGQKIFCR